MTVRTGGPATPVVIVNDAGEPIPTNSAGSGGAVTIADGADVAQGAKADAAVTNPALSASEIALLKGLLTVLGTSAAKVQGLAADGAAVSGNPVLIGGADGSSNAQTLLATSAGRSQIAMGAALSTDGAGTPAAVADSSDATRSLAATIYVFNGTNRDTLRTSAIFKTALATSSGDTAVWSPSSKKFRLMAYSIEVTGNATQAVAGVIEIVLRDATTAIGLGMSVFIPSVALNVFGNYSTGWRVLVGNGHLSATQNNALNVNLSAALTAGEVRVNAIGTEE